jgi:hypothetical protein
MAGEDTTFHFTAVVQDKLQAANKSSPSAQRMFTCTLASHHRSFHASASLCLLRNHDKHSTSRKPRHTAEQHNSTPKLILQKSRNHDGL